MLKSTSPQPNMRPFDACTCPLWLPQIGHVRVEHEGVVPSLSPIALLDLNKLLVMSEDAALALPEGQRCDTEQAKAFDNMTVEGPAITDFNFIMNVYVFSLNQRFTCVICFGDCRVDLAAQLGRDCQGVLPQHHENNILLQSIRTVHAVLATVLESGRYCCLLLSASVQHMGFGT